MKYTTSDIKGIKLSADAQTNFDYLEEQGYINEFENYLKEQQPERELFGEKEVSDLLEYRFDEVLEALGIPGKHDDILEESVKLRESLSKLVEDDDEDDDDDDEICEIVVFGALPTIKEKVIRPNNFINSYEIYTGRKREFDGVLVFIPEDDAAGFEQFLQENNFRYANKEDLESRSKLVEDAEDDTELFGYHAVVAIKKGAEYTESADDFKEALQDSIEQYFDGIGVEYIIDSIDITEEENTLEAEIVLSLDDDDFETSNLISALYDDGIYNWSASDFEQVTLKFNESLNEDAEGSRAEELKKLFQDAFSGGKMNCFETAKGVVYVEPQGESLVFGGMTNAGIIPEYTYEYDFDQSFDWNLQGMIEQIMEEEGYPEQE